MSFALENLDTQPEKPDGETIVRNVLRGLPEEYRIFHQPQINRDEAFDPYDRPLDFIIIHPHKGILGIIARCGEITEEQNGLINQYQPRRFLYKIMDPAKMAQNAMRALMLDCDPDWRDGLPIGYAVFMPDTRLAEFSEPKNIFFFAEDFSSDTFLTRLDDMFPEMLDHDAHERFERGYNTFSEYLKNHSSLKTPLMMGRDRARSFDRAHKHKPFVVPREKLGRKITQSSVPASMPEPEPLPEQSATIHPFVKPEVKAEERPEEIQEKIQEEIVEARQPEPEAPAAKAIPETQPEEKPPEPPMMAVPNLRAEITARQAPRARAPTPLQKPPIAKAPAQAPKPQTAPPAARQAPRPANQAAKPAQSRAAQAPNRNKPVTKPAARLQPPPQQYELPDVLDFFQRMEERVHFPKTYTGLSSVQWMIATGVAAILIICCYFAFRNLGIAMAM